MLVEAEHLKSVGIEDAFERTSVDASALLITPFQQAANRLRELLRGRDAHGTCGVGVGECMADALSGLDDTVRAGDLSDPDRLRKRLASQQRRKRMELVAAKRLIEPKAFLELGILEDDGVVDKTVELWTMLSKQLEVVPDSSVVQAEPRVVLEGAQGILLDETWGFHPHTTWSDCTVRPAMKLLGGREAKRIGATRAYMIRHGAGPFPSHDRRFDQVLPEQHNHELGWQGAVRRGPLDLVLLRYAVDVAGGLDALAVTNTDRLAGGPVIPVCAAYQLDESAGGVRRDQHGQVVSLEPGAPEELEHREKLGTLLGWTEALYYGVPTEQWVNWLEGELGLPVWLESRGPTAADKRWLIDP